MFFLVVHFLLFLLSGLLKVLLLLSTVGTVCERSYTCGFVLMGRQGKGSAGDVLFTACGLAWYMCRNSLIHKGLTHKGLYFQCRQFGGSS